MTARLNLDWMNAPAAAPEPSTRRPPAEPVARRCECGDWAILFFRRGAADLAFCGDCAPAWLRRPALHPLPQEVSHG